MNFSRKEPKRSAVMTGHKNCIILIFTLWRVMQGSKRKKEKPSNVIMMCSFFIRNLVCLYLFCKHLQPCSLAFLIHSLAGGHLAMFFSGYNRNAIKLHLLTAEKKWICSLRYYVTITGTKIRCNLRILASLKWHNIKCNGSKLANTRDE